MNWVGTIGLWLIGIAASLVVVCAVVFVAPAALRLRRASVATRGLVADYRQGMGAELWQLRERELERALLLRPIRRVRRVIMHPLTVALMESFSRRQERARDAAREAAGT